MDSPAGQTGASTAPDGRTSASATTRQRLMGAAAGLIAEVGWGRVTTRAVAERAGLPHGAVSYHFRGKQELLIEAAMDTFEQAIPIEEFEAPKTVEDMIGLIDAEVGESEAIDRLLSRLMIEAMREAERDLALRGRLGAMLGSYRDAMVEVVRADQERGAAFAGASPEAIATLLGAVGDGLLLHALLDPALDARAAVEGLRAMLRQGGR